MEASYPVAARLCGTGTDMHATGAATAWGTCVAVRPGTAIPDDAVVLTCGGLRAGAVDIRALCRRLLS
ncbi:hypothetical protein HW130_33530 [Streptomyces sp. PKU-EA00015]|nr:hypothetical protein [Streptomyces sp. PKU-EA00015]